MNEQLRKMLIDGGIPENYSDDQARGYMVGLGVPAQMNDEALGFLQGRSAVVVTAPAVPTPPAEPATIKSEDDIRLIEQGKRSEIVEEVRGTFANFPEHNELFETCRTDIMAGKMTADGARKALLDAKAKNTTPGHVIVGRTSEDTMRQRMANAILSRNHTTAAKLSEEDKKRRRPVSLHGFC